MPICPAPYSTCIVRLAIPEQYILFWCTLLRHVLFFYGIVLRHIKVNKLRVKICHRVICLSDNCENRRPICKKSLPRTSPQNYLCCCKTAPTLVGTQQSNPRPSAGHPTSAHQNSWVKWKILHELRRIQQVVGEQLLDDPAAWHRRFEGSETTWTPFMIRGRTWPHFNLLLQTEINGSEPVVPCHDFDPSSDGSQASYETPDRQTDHRPSYSGDDGHAQFCPAVWSVWGEEEAYLAPGHWDAEVVTSSMLP